jgi:hypothetical protein
MLTREQATKIAGQDTIKRLDKENCEPTGRCGYCGYRYGDELTEWKATTHYQDEKANDSFISALYYTDKDQDKALEVNGDGADIEWHIAGYIID